MNKLIITSIHYLIFSDFLKTFRAIHFLSIFCVKFDCLGRVNLFCDMLFFLAKDEFSL